MPNRWLKVENKTKPTATTGEVIEPTAISGLHDLLFMIGGDKVFYSVDKKDWIEIKEENKVDQLTAEFTAIAVSQERIICLDTSNPSFPRFFELKETAGTFSLKHTLTVDFKISKIALGFNGQYYALEEGDKKIRIEKNGVWESIPIPLTNTDTILDLTVDNNDKLYIIIKSTSSGENYKIQAYDRVTKTWSDYKFNTTPIKAQAFAFSGDILYTIDSNGTEIYKYNLTNSLQTKVMLSGPELDSGTTIKEIATLGKDFFIRTHNTPTNTNSVENFIYYCEHAGWDLLNMYNTSTSSALIKATQIDLDTNGVPYISDGIKIYKYDYNNSNWSTIGTKTNKLLAITSKRCYVTYNVSDKIYEQLGHNNSDFQDTFGTTKHLAASEYIDNSGNVTNNIAHIGYDGKWVYQALKTGTDRIVQGDWTKISEKETLKAIAVDGKFIYVIGTDQVLHKYDPDATNNWSILSKFCPVVSIEKPTLTVSNGIIAVLNDNHQVAFHNGQIGKKGWEVYQEHERWKDIAIVGSVLYGISSTGSGKVYKNA